MWCSLQEEEGGMTPESQEAVLFFVLQHLKMQPWATTASWSPFHLSRREIHTTTILANRTILSSGSGPLHTRLKLNSFLASPSDSSGEPPVSTPFPQAPSESGSCRGSGRVDRDISRGPHPTALTYERAPTGWRPV